MASTQYKIKETPSMDALRVAWRAYCEANDLGDQDRAAVMAGAPYGIPDLDAYLAARTTLEADWLAGRNTRWFTAHPSNDTFCFLNREWLTYDELELVKAAFYAKTKVPLFRYARRLTEQDRVAAYVRLADKIDEFILDFRTAFVRFNGANDEPE